MNPLTRLRRWLLIRRMARWLARLDAVDFYLELADHVPIPEPAVRDLHDLRAELLESFSRFGFLSRALERQRLPIALNRKLKPIRAPWPRGRFPHRWWECHRLAEGWTEALERRAPATR